MPSLVQLITNDTGVSNRSVVVAVGEWTNTFFTRELRLRLGRARFRTLTRVLHRHEGMLSVIQQLQRDHLSSLQTSKSVKFRTCEQEDCPLSPLTPIWPRTVVVFGKHKTGFQRCSWCKQATYCSRACQRANWVLHKTYTARPQSCTQPRGAPTKPAEPFR